MINHLTDQCVRATLRRRGIPVSKRETIINAADRATVALREQLGGDAASVALAIALGKLCAEAGLPLADVLAMAEVSHREIVAELLRVAAAA